jgi:hypothetical protein
VTTMENRHDLENIKENSTLDEKVILKLISEK